MSEVHSNLVVQPEKFVWLPQEILDWPVMTEIILCGSAGWERHYDPWEHARESLSGRAFEQDRASAILQLRRAIDLRDKALKSLYSLDKIPGFGKSAYPKILSDLRIIMPLMRRKLIDVRNEVAHERVESDVDLNRCWEYCEFTWYFLKSTDHLLSSPIHTLQFSNESDSSSFSLSFDLTTWSVELSGKFNLLIILKENRGHDIKIPATIVLMENGFGYPKRHPVLHGDPGSEHCVICDFDQETMVKLLRIYFSTRY